MEMMELSAKVDSYSMSYADLPVALAVRDVVDKRRKLKSYNYQGAYDGDFFSNYEATPLQAMVKKEGALHVPPAQKSDYQLDYEALTASESSLSRLMGRIFCHDYSNAIYALAASRAAALQVIAYLSPLALFVGKTARYPIFIFCSHLESQLHPLLPPAAPYKAARQFSKLPSMKP